MIFRISAFGLVNVSLRRSLADKCLNFKIGFLRASVSNKELFPVLERSFSLDFLVSSVAHAISKHSTKRRLQVKTALKINKSFTQRHFD